MGVPRQVLVYDDSKKLSFSDLLDREVINIAQITWRDGPGRLATAFH
jgi:hypothetical protein